MRPGNSESAHQQIISVLRRLQRTGQSFDILLAVVVGLVVGGAAYLFETLLHAGSWFFGTFLPSLTGDGSPWGILIPALGALMLAPFIWAFPKDAVQDGVPATMEAVALRSGVMKWWSSLLRMVMSSLTLGSGGSAGSEGPIIQIGSALASGVGQFLGISGNRLRVIVACGAAAGLAAIFNAPIAGVLFALEVVMGEFNITSFSPIVISSVVATACSRAFLNRGAVLSVLPYHLFSSWEIFFYAILGVVAGLVSVVFIRTMGKAERIFERLEHLKVSRALRPTVGGLCVGVLGYFVPQILGYSYLPIAHAVHDKFELSTLLIFVVFKVVATAFTLGSGGSGGILCPSLFLGAMLGSACGEIFHGIFPHVAVTPGAYGVVGMGAVLGAVVQAPMTAIIMVFELTNEYTVILPMMTSCILATLVQRRLLNGSIYTLNLTRKGVDIQAGREMGILSSLRVRDIMDPDAVTLAETASFDEVLRQCLGQKGNYVYMVDEKQSLQGVISFTDLKGIVFEQELNGLVLAKDVANADVVVVTPDESLASALNKFSAGDMEQLPVVETANGWKRIKGVVTRSRLLHAYRQELVKRAFIDESPRQISRHP